MRLSPSDPGALVLQHRATLGWIACGLIVVATLAYGVGWLTHEAGSRLITASGGRLEAGLDFSPTANPSARDATAVASAGREVARASGREGQATPVAPSAVIKALAERRLTLPVQGARVEQLVPSFDESRGDRRHEAIDIMAPRGTPVVAVEDGEVAKLFKSQFGGLTIYQFDPSKTFAYYYAHLDRYADGLHEGQHLRRGQIIGYVGSTGNAHPAAPHLHFAVFSLGPERYWWEGTPLDPYPIFRP
jgi:murein DD-endopeptidase MepM/ murein hydrolase activator NlpD